MKNIHVLPTDKPSMLHKAFDKTFILSTEPTCKNDLYKSVPYNICITDDSEIKIGDWCITSKGNLLQMIEGDTVLGFALLGCQKIILTTDADLINDGVQAIDDEFLEFFVKNPSYEFVETLFHYPTICDEEDYFLNLGYLTIIIPKEEIKQDWFCPKCNSYVSSECVTFEETHQICNTGVVIKETKQETLEEAALEFAKDHHEMYETNNIGAMHFGFCLGAKWQQEQNKNLYSEEDLEKAYKDGGRNEYDFINKYHCKARISFDKWFEQFKKK